MSHDYYNPTPAEIAETCHGLRTGQIVVMSRTTDKPLRTHELRGGFVARNDDEEKAWRRGQVNESEVDDETEGG